MFRIDFSGKFKFAAAGHWVGDEKKIDEVRLKWCHLSADEFHTGGNSRFCLLEIGEKVAFYFRCRTTHTFRGHQRTFTLRSVCVCVCVCVYGAGAAVLRGERFTDSAALAHMTDLLAVFEK